MFGLYAIEFSERLAQLASGFFPIVGCFKVDDAGQLAIHVGVTVVGVVGQLIGPFRRFRRPEPAADSRLSFSDSLGRDARPSECRSKDISNRNWQWRFHTVDSVP